MNKKIFFYIAIIFLLNSISYAANFPFSGTITTGKDVIINNDIFKFTYDPVSDKAFVQTPDTNLIIANGNCKGNDYYWVCIKSANLSYKNATTFVNHYIMNVEIENPANKSATKQPDEPAQATATGQINASTGGNTTTAALNFTGGNTTAVPDIIIEQPVNQTANETSPVQAQNQKNETIPEANSKIINTLKEDLQTGNIKPKSSNKKAIFASIFSLIIIILMGVIFYKIRLRRKPIDQNKIADTSFDEFMKK
ncbi:MAG: hypothetical protein AABX00_04410 [Nanoarchaeota archaeon]